MDNISFHRIAFPYCLQRQKDGSYVLLNREYKPIGFFTHDCLDYGAYPIGIRFTGLKDETIRKISIDPDPQEGTIYLYDDGTVPIRNNRNMKEYLDRLSVLMRLKVQ
jgi:hypothetical protein